MTLNCTLEHGRKGKFYHNLTKQNKPRPTPGPSRGAVPRAGSSPFFSWPLWLFASNDLIGVSITLGALKTMHGPGLSWPQAAQQDAQGLVGCRG